MSESHDTNLIKLASIILEKKYDELYNYTQFDFEQLSAYNILIPLIQTFPVEHLHYFIDNIIDLQVTDNDNSEWKPIHYFVRYASEDVIIYFLKKDIDFNQKTSLARTPLHLALMYSSENVCKYLINIGSDIEASDNEGWRPIHYSIRYCVPEISNLLINKGVKLDIATNNGWYPIHMALRYCRDISYNLVANNLTDLEIPDSVGWYPIHYAIRYAELPLIKLILEKGVNLNRVLNNGYQIMDFANQFANKDVIAHIDNFINK
jgi:ankyrin repeat protein